MYRDSSITGITPSTRIFVFVGRSRAERTYCTKIDVVLKTNETIAKLVILWHYQIVPRRYSARDSFVEHFERRARVATNAVVTI